MPNTPDLLLMVVRIAYTLPGFMKLAQAIFALIGVWLFCTSLLDLYNYNNDRYNGQRKTLGGVFGRMLASVVLTSSLWFVVATGNTLVGTSTAGGAMLYQSGGLSEMQLAAVHAVFGMFMFGGYVWFCISWMLLDKHFNGGREGVWGPILQMIAGVALVFSEEWVPLVMEKAGLSIASIF
jgi:hypothetical protein